MIVVDKILVTVVYLGLLGVAIGFIVVNSGPFVNTVMGLGILWILAGLYSLWAYGDAP